jgi:uncharacterized membrane protein YfcA
MRSLKFKIIKCAAKGQPVNHPKLASESIWRTIYLTILTFTALMFLFSLLAGLLGALTGLGGGIVVTPALVLLFHVNIHYAMGASLISVIATSSGTSAAYLREGYTNLRIGMFLETAAVMGAIIGAILIVTIPTTLLTILFSLVLFFSAYLTMQRREDQEQFQTSHPWALTLQLNSSYPHANQLKKYCVQNVPLALFIMGVAGLISGLLGIGSGALKVLAMDQALRLPYKVATTTSNFMIGITAAASAGVYFSHGFINPILAFPVMLGVIIGSFCGAKILLRVHSRTLRLIFSSAICLIGLQMLIKALTGMV